jgi:CheY-like chemotaxis protein
VQSEVGKGTIFSMELPFQHAQIPGISKSKKLRNIFLPSSVGSPKSPLQSTAPFMKSPRPNSTEQRKSLIHIPDEGSFAPRVHVEQLEEDNGSRSGAYAHDFDRYDMDANEIEGSKSSVPLNVLVAGENSISLGMLNKKLSSKGHTVEVASSGQEAHDFFSSNMSKFDVILMDSEVYILLTQCSWEGSVNEW